MQELQRRMGDGVTVDLGNLRLISLGRNVAGSGAGIVTVRTNPLFRVNVRSLQRPGLYKVDADAASDGLYYLVFLPTLSLGVFPLMFVSWLATRGLKRRVIAALMSPDGQAAPADDNGLPRLLTGAAARREAHPVWSVVLDLGRVLLGGLLLLGIGASFSELSLGFPKAIHLVDIVVPAIVCGIAGMLLLSGAGSLIRRPVGWSWLIGALVLGALAYIAALFAGAE